MVEQTVDALGALDVLVNNASTNVVGNHPTDFAHLTDEQLMERVTIKGLGAACGTGQLSPTSDAPVRAGSSVSGE